MPIAGFSKQMQSICLCLCMSGCKVVHAERQMEFVVAEVVGIVPVAQPRQLEQVGAFAIGQVYDDEAAVVSADAADFGQAERLLDKMRATGPDRGR